MQAFHFNRKSLSQVDTQHLNLVYNQEVYLPYINRTFSFEGFEKQIQEKSAFEKSKRAVLVQALKQQYKEISTSSEVEANIELLNRKNTFTITTGHQLSLFTGPLYFVVKIMHVIKLCERLRKEYPSSNFVPVYWMASEDHDFEEIQSFKLFNQKIKWDSNQTGPVGRFNLDGMEEIRSVLKESFSNHPDTDIHELIDIYSGENLAQATARLVDKMFSKYGVVVIDADKRELKQVFEPILQKELSEGFSYKAVTETNVRLQKDGAKIQVTPRELNLFYIKDGIRNRITRLGEQFHIEEIGSMSLKGILEELSEYPERFSPNVILRPLYQETILPNLAYIGGVGEISYWLQLKGVFDKANVVFPMISVRNSILWIDELTSKKISKIDLVLEDLFNSVHQIKKEFVQKHSSDELNFDELDDNLEKLSDSMQRAILSTGSSMDSFASSEVVKLGKQMDNLKSKLIRMSKANHETSMKTIDQILERLFPGNNLQERSVNFFQFCSDGDYKQKLDALHKYIDPAINDLIVIRD